MGREAESDKVVEARAAAANSAETMLTSFTDSDEFRAHVAGKIIHDYLMANYYNDCLDIEVDVSERILDQMFDRIRQEWSMLGDTEPYWSVITSDKFRANKIKEHMEAFLTSGRSNVKWMKNIAKRNGIDLGKQQTCFELGCGVGRLTLPLSEVFHHVTGYDISPGNLAECDALVKAQGKRNITTKLLARIEDLKSAPEFDVLFTVIVLQHNPPPVQKYILDILLTKIRPNGIAYFQLPTFIPDYKFTARTYLRTKPQSMEMHAVPMRDVLELLREHGFQVLEVLQDPFTGMPGSHSFFAVKTAEVTMEATPPPDRGIWRRLSGR
ncbi:class I SAM-dependent methyltransferase [Marinobacter sp.]|uniref:class I SAM-dependent methyltransferase n=1 Tax=Marinobacter sp. TaxID=50741 RepID=UPI002B4A7A51|nr:class I SAM-dependent methyltransferase [Marinobacter sp.]HKK56287.1 class I SAM-dependent methyltransferase [Marinobacter sp.]